MSADDFGKGDLPFVLIDGVPCGISIRMCPIAPVFRLQARQVLNDAYQALAMLEEQDDLTLARIQYFALVALLRSVGHVLDKVDGGNSPKIKGAASAMYQKIKRNPEKFEIFHHFIEAERNLVLKEYRSGAQLVSPMPVVTLPDGSEQIFDGYKPFPMFVFEDGPFDGDDARDVAPQAIEFWNDHLTRIEMECFGESFWQIFPPISRDRVAPKDVVRPR